MPGTSRPDSRPAWLPTPQTEGVGLAAFGPLVLKPKQTPLGSFFGILFVAALWNGITGVFVWHLISSFREGNPDWGLALFLSIFVLIGLGLLLAVPYTFLALWNPRPHLTLGRGTLRLGDRVDLEWRFTGRPGRIQRLRITFEGREEATYTTRRSRSNSSTSTVREVFHTVELLDTTEPILIPAGMVRLAIPAESMHSFASTHNRIVWTLEVKAEIRRWPDVAEPFEVAVLPRIANAAGAAGAAGGGS